LGEIFFNLRESRTYNKLVPNEAREARNVLNVYILCF